MSEQVIIDGELNLDSDFDGLPNEQIIVNVTGAPKIIDKASGKIVSIVDGAENEKLLSAVVNIEPVQSGSGDPSPTNIRPISGWSQVDGVAAGKNLAPKSAAGSKANVMYTVADDGAVTSSGTANGSSFYQLSSVYLKANVQYTLSGCASGGGQGKYGLGLLTSDNSSVLATDFGSGATYIPSADGMYNICVRFWYGQAINGTWKPQLELGSTATAYEPYVGDTYPIPLGRTVYGGTLDVARGKLNAKPYYASYSGQTLVGPWISSHDKYVAGATPTTGAQVVDVGAAGTEYDVTPQTIKTLLGTNNIWADAGGMEVEYVADTKLYIQRLTAPTEDDMIANENIASGKFFMVGNDLYFSTAAIVAGETIAPGTNCTKLSLAEALNNINA